MKRQSQKKTQESSLILASSSPYRKMLLERLGLAFETRSPEIDEARRAGETPEAMVARLARAKARAIAMLQPTAVVIGSDQIAVCNGEIVGKPGSPEKAAAQLKQFSARTVLFLTAVALVSEESGCFYERTVATDIDFRELGDAEIHRYIEMDRPLDCAGSFKSEAAGVTLLRAMRSDDPTAIIGLPLICVSEALRQAGFKLP